MSTLVFNPVRLIEEVKARPGLYAAERWDRTERLDLWREVGAAIFPDWGECNKSTVYGRVLQIQKKWKSLRDAYNRELRFRKSNAKRSRIVYRYFKRMSFLGGFEGTIPSSDEASTGGQDITFSQDLEDVNKKFKEEAIEELPVLKKVKKLRKKRRKRKVSSEAEDIPEPIEDAEEMEMPMFPMEFSGDVENDSDKLFLLSFVPEMRQLPSHIKMWTRAQIANIMQEAVSSHYNNTKPGTSSEHVDVKRYKHDSPDS